MCQGSEYPSGSENATVLKYKRFLNMLVLHMVLNMPESFLNMSDYAGICLNMPEYTRISVNISKSVRAPFVSHAPIVIPCLLKRVVTHFDEVYSLKEHEAVS